MKRICISLLVICTYLFALNLLKQIFLHWASTNLCLVSSIRFHKIVEHLQKKRKEKWMSRDQRFVNLKTFRSVKHSTGIERNLAAKLLSSTKKRFRACKRLRGWGRRIMSKRRDERTSLYAYLFIIALNFLMLQFEHFWTFCRERPAMLSSGVWCVNIHICTER